MSGQMRSLLFIPGDSDKKLAKAKRRELNGVDEQSTPSQHLRYVVSPGPDHHNYRG